MFQSPGKVALDIGPLSIHWYGILIATGILLCYWYITKELKRRNLEQKPVDDMMVWLIITGVLGARLYYVLFNFSYYSEFPLEIFMVWKGGLAIHGALIGGLLAYMVFVWRQKNPWLLYLDVLIPGVLLAQALGRWGNFFNSEAFGGPTNLPWKLFIPEENRPEGFEDFEFFHPTFLYESLWNFFGFLLLVWLSHTLHPKTASSKPKPGSIFFAYLMWYSLGRFFIEGLRTDSLYIGDLRTAQIMSIALFFSGLLGLLFLRKKTTI